MVNVRPKPLNCKLSECRVLTYVTVEEPGTGVIRNKSDRDGRFTCNFVLIVRKTAVPLCYAHAPRTGRYNVTARGVDVVGRSSGTLNDIKGMAAVERREMSSSSVGWSNGYVLKMEGMIGEAANVDFDDGTRVDDHGIPRGVKIARLSGTGEHLEQTGELGRRVRDVVDDEGQALVIHRKVEGQIEHLVCWTRTRVTRFVQRHFFQQRVSFRPCLSKNTTITYQSYARAAGCRLGMAGLMLGRRHLRLHSGGPQRSSYRQLHHPLA